MKRIITISREFGSGGRTIAKQVAETLGYAYYDKELVKKVACESGFSEDFINEDGEYACATNSFSFNWAINAGIGSNAIPLSDQLYVFQHKIIAELAEKGNCVIVGRCADYILRRRDDCLNVFFCAATAFRANRIVQLYGETNIEPEKRLKEKDEKRRAYYKHYTGGVWGLAQNYHVALDTSVVGIEQCADIVAKIARNG